VEKKNKEVILGEVHRDVSMAWQSFLGQACRGRRVINDCEPEREALASNDGEVNILPFH
jgi:hypothetical protein